MISNKLDQFGHDGIVVEGLVIHNTNSQKNAMELAQTMEDSSLSNACHYFVDWNGIIEVIPESRTAFSTGRGFDFGNEHCIAVEICTSICNEKNIDALHNASILIRRLIERHSLRYEDIYFHRDFQPNVNCPADIIKRFGSKHNFIRAIKENRI